MRTTFRRSFERDIGRVADSRTRDKLRDAIEAVERAGSLRDVPNLKKLSGTSGFYRIRVGEYRIGVAVEGESVDFVRVLHRREIYRYFP